MLGSESFQRLNYGQEKNFIQRVTGLAKDEGTETSLNSTSIYVFNYDMQTGGFRHCDIIRRDRMNDYAGQNLLNDYKRLFASHDGQGNWHLFFDGKEIKQVYEQVGSSWENRIFQASI